MEDIIRETMGDASNVFFLGQISRSEYLNIAAACDVGLVCTVDGVDVPTFPSKSIDYFRAKLPILASVELTTDYGSFISENLLGRVCEAGNPKALFETLMELIETPILMLEMGENGFQIYQNKFHVKKVAHELLLQVHTNKV